MCCDSGLDRLTDWLYDPFFLSVFGIKVEGVLIEKRMMFQYRKEGEIMRDFVI